MVSQGGCPWPPGFRLLLVCGELAACGKNVQDLLQFVPQVRHVHGRSPRKRKRGLTLIGLALFAQLHARSRDREAVFVEQSLDPHHRLHIALAVHALAGAAFYGLELREFSFPEPEYVGGQTAQAGDFADPEIELVRNNDFGVAARFLRHFLAEVHGPVSPLPYTRF